MGSIGSWSTQAYATITNSYSIGNVSGTTVKYQVLGKILGFDYGNGRKDFENLYYLDTSSGGSNSYGGIAKTSEQLKELAAILGNEFIKDDTNINNGYPILRWEVNIGE